MFSAFHLAVRRRSTRRKPRRSFLLPETSCSAALIGQALESRQLLAFAGELELVTVTAALTAPVTATHAGDGSGRLFVAEQGGRIQIVQSGAVRPTPFLDLSDRIVSGGERGLLGLAFHPDYVTPGAVGQGKFYVYYSEIGRAHV